MSLVQVTSESSAQEGKAVLDLESCFGHEGTEAVVVALLGLECELCRGELQGEVLGSVGKENESRNCKYFE